MAGISDHRTSILALLREASIFVDLPAAELELFSDLLSLVIFNPDDQLVTEGQATTDLYVLISGTARAIGRDLIGQDVSLYAINPGESVGESALMENPSHGPTVVCDSLVTAYRLAWQDFDTVRNACPGLYSRLREFGTTQQNRAYLRGRSVFARLEDHHLHRLAEKLVSVEVPVSGHVVQEGETGDRFFLVCSGQLSCTKKGRQVAVFEVGDFFGETALLASVLRTATITATKPSKLLSLSKSAFHELILNDPVLINTFSEILRIRFTDAAAQQLGKTVEIQAPKPRLKRVTTEKYWTLLLVGGALFMVLSLLSFLLKWPWLVYPSIIVGSLIGPVVYVVYLAETDILHQRPIILISVFGLSGIVGLVISMALHKLTGSSIGTLWNGLQIGVNEEVAKLIAVMILLFRRNSRFEMDGILYGAAAGMGFAAVENMVYGLVRKDAMAELFSTLWARTILAPFGHGTWTAIICAGLWRLRAAPRSPRRWIEFVTGFVISVFLHGAWDWPWISGRIALPWYLLLGAVGLWILRYMVMRALTAEVDALIALNPDIETAAETAAQVQCRSCGELAPKGARFCPRCAIALRVETSS